MEVQHDPGRLHHVFRMVQKNVLQTTKKYAQHGPEAGFAKTYSGQPLSRVPNNPCRLPNTSVLHPKNNNQNHCTRMIRDMWIKIVSFTHSNCEFETCIGRADCPLVRSIIIICIQQENTNSRTIFLCSFRVAN